SPAPATPRSYCEPFFGSSDGARWRVTRWSGQLLPASTTAARQRSLASLIMASGSPTKTVLGSPLDTSTSTSTARPESPSKVTERVNADITPHLLFVR